MKHCTVLPSYTELMKLTDFGKLARHYLILLWSCPLQVELVLMKGYKTARTHFINSFQVGTN
jgi:hypothetical protein